MLVISRKPGQSFTIGDDITVTITAVHGNQVKVGIDAPRELDIRRDDMLKGKKENGNSELNGEPHRQLRREEEANE